MQTNRRESSSFKPIGTLELSVINRDEAPESLRLAAVRWHEDDSDPSTVRKAVEISHHVGGTRVIATLLQSEAKVLLDLLGSAVEACTTPEASSR